MIRALDLTTGAAGAYATLLLAEIGADVILVEPPEGCEMRQQTGTEDFTFEFLHRRKRSVTCDLRTRAGREVLAALLGTAEVVFEDCQPGRGRQPLVAWPEVKDRFPSLVMVSITPFGQTGPRATWKASEFVLQAMGGVVSSTGFDDSAPQRLPGNQAAYVAGLHAAGAALAAVYGMREGKTPAVHVDISVQECMATYATRDISRFAYTGQDVQRFGRDFGMQGWPPISLAKDGYVMLEALRAEWEAFALFLGLDDRFLTHEFHDARTRAERWSEIAPDFERAVALRTKHEWFEASAAQGYTFAPIDDVLEVLSSPQLAARGFPGRIPGRNLASPSMPFSHSFGVAMPNRAPRPGEHNEILWGAVDGRSLESERRAR
jgi:crotonobetainyl-CoA:carnitine CoA-transferase CaiB-like acyl-CoA transferase